LAIGVAYFFTRHFEQAKAMLLRSLLVEFGSVVDALRCATEVQAGMAERNAEAPADKRIDFRIGINVGDIVVEDGDIFGDGVNVAARLEALAERGASGILTSSTTPRSSAQAFDLPGQGRWPGRDGETGRVARSPTVSGKWRTPAGSGRCRSRW
jgi:class 3 adenylate cyclase